MEKTQNQKKKYDFVFFPLSLSIFGVAAWFPFDKGQSVVGTKKIKEYL